jgi:acetylornithine deacetylase/succinyl-diaminopimelate desuccinylase-like protein
MIRSLSAAAALALLVAPVAAVAQDRTQTPAAGNALDILIHSVGFRTVEGAGQVPAYAAYLKALLVDGGYADAEVEIHPMGESAALIARWPGADPALKPLVLLAHMDVVQADPADWTRDPFTAVVENGYVYGRGAFDNKADLSIVVATLIQLRQSGWTPRRSIVLALSGDEETAMATSRWLAERLRDAEMVFNADSGGGLLAEDGAPTVFKLQAAEKTYADYTVTVTDPGGHSSRPGPTNAIYRLNAALARLAAHRFPVTYSPITTAYIAASGPEVRGPSGDALRRLAVDPADAEAIAVLDGDPEYVGLIRTTCIATMINGGHAPNALPQRATANVNCRIFPGTTMAEIQTALTGIMADPGVIVTYQDSGTVDAPSSPLRSDLMGAVTAAVHARAPGLPIVPTMEAGATDSMHFRALGVPSYGVSSVFIKPADDLSHGLNERLPVATLAPGVRQWDALLRDLAQ